MRVPPAGALQVTPTGQVATSYPGSETVFSLNLKRAPGKIPEFVSPQTLVAGADGCAAGDEGGGGPATASAYLCRVAERASCRPLSRSFTIPPM